MRIHILQHVPFEGAAGIEDWAVAHNYPMTTTRFYAQESFPSLERFDLLVVMGGPMSIHDEHLYPWLKGEKWFIRQAIDAGKAVLGVCLGAQLIAEVLGGEVYQGEQKEIGWFPIHKNKGLADHPLGTRLPDEMTVFHWHGETFTLPEGAQRIASSTVCTNQGFIYQDRIVALQFHLESTPLSVESIIEYCADELVEAPFVQGAEELLAETRYFTPLKDNLQQVLEYLQTQIGS